ncbi:tetraspanin-4 [Platysternon megacephalum]|uniref:Tetraspanin-4 n=1 Tax=Platysternon megacephalum TaxID=55544 RepID=A0A4D9E656_9SAUR|nr:tetraspanin-4 [Platysternon megacephalum]
MRSIFQIWYTGLLQSYGAVLAGSGIVPVSAITQRERWQLTVYSLAVFLSMPGPVGVVNAKQSTPTTNPLMWLFHKALAVRTMGLIQSPWKSIEISGKISVGFGLHFSIHFLILTRKLCILQTHFFAWHFRHTSNLLLLNPMGFMKMYYNLVPDF